MALAALLLAVVALGFIPLGVVLAPVPVVGGVFAFGAPACALAGLITGGVALSRAKRAGRAPGLAMASVITSGLAFFPALLTALTCGVCNALFTAGDVQTQRNFSFHVGPSFVAVPGDAGVVPESPPPAPSKPLPPGAPPPAFPPPPITR